MTIHDAILHRSDDWGPCTATCTGCKWHATMPTAHEAQTAHVVHSGGRAAPIHDNLRVRDDVTFTD